MKPTVRRLEIEVGDWEHLCCGAEIRRRDDVRWTVIVGADGTYSETHHDLEGLKTIEVAGTVVELEVVENDGSRVPITRIPSGTALSRHDPSDRGDVIELSTNRVIDPSEGGFIVTVEMHG